MLAKQGFFIYTINVMKSKELILASKSPRRNDILLEQGFKFSICVADYKEKEENHDPIQTAVNNAYGKAKAVFENLNNPNAVVIGADTVVCLNSEILGKPLDKNDAINTLKRLSGNTHTVVTGYALITAEQEIKGHSQSFVTFNKLSDSLILEYVNSGLPLDKAGSYGIQDGYPLVENFKGSFSNIVGLPIEDIKPKLDKLLK